jgi:hypothetical protein
MLIYHIIMLLTGVLFVHLYKVFLCISQRPCFCIYHQQSRDSNFCRLQVDRIKKIPQMTVFFNIDVITV